MSIINIIIIFLIPGLAGWLAFGQQLRKHVSLVEAAFLIVMSSVIATSWIAIVLAEFEIFSLSTLTILLLFGSLLLSIWAIQSGHASNPLPSAPFSPLSLLIFPILGLTIWLSPQPYEYINGGRDHGLYINTGLHIARSGGIFIYDSELAAVPPESKQLLINPAVSTEHSLLPGPWSDGRRLPGGMTIRDLERGIVTPQSFHLYPVMIAIFAAAGGVNFALMTTTLLGILGIWSVYVAIARLFGQPVGLIASFLLAISLSQIWYTRTPSAEILLQPLFWSGLFAFTLMLTTNDRYAAVLAGLSFGLMHLAKLDTIFVFIILVIFLLYRWFRNQFPSTYWYFAIPYGLLSLHALLHAFFIATIYFLEQMARLLLPEPIGQAVIKAASGHNYPIDILGRLLSQNAIFIVVSLVGFIILLFVARYFRPAIGRGLSFIDQYAYQGKVVASLVFVLLLMGIYLTPMIQSVVGETNSPLASRLFQMAKGSINSQQFATFIKWYLTPLGVFLAMIGLVQISSDERQTPNGPGIGTRSTIVWLLLVGNILPFFILGAGTHADQFWAIRRFVPIALPVLIMFSAYAIWQLAPKHRQEWNKGLLPLGLLGVLVIGHIGNVLPFLRFNDYGGMIDQTAKVAESFPEDAVLLFENTFANGRVAAPLWQVFGRTVFMLEEGAITDPDLTSAVEQWWENGREVFWLSSGDESPTLPNNIAAHYEGQRTWSLLWAERPTSYIPKQSGLFLNSVDVHRLVEGDANKQKAISTTIPLTWELGNPTGDVVPVEGLHNVQQRPGLTPRRWTSGQTIIQIPVSGELTEILMMMGNGRPSHVSSAEVSVYLNDTHLDTVQVNGTNDIFAFPLPAELTFPAETAELRLEMEAWIPAETNFSADQRQLGVYLDWIKLIETHTK